jgi:hypothetical protein
MKTEEVSCSEELDVLSEKSRSPSWTGVLKRKLKQC